MRTRGERGRGGAEKTSRADAGGSLVGKAITGVTPMPADERWTLVRVGRRRAGTVESVRVGELGVAVGAAWTEAMEAACAEAERYVGLRLFAVRTLARRALSKGQAAEKLAARAMKREPDLERADARRLAERIAEEMREIGLIDDAALAADVAGTLARRGATGRRLAETKLRSKRIAPEVARRAAAEAYAEVDALEQAVALARSRVERMREKPDRDTLMKRLVGVLARRGFDGGVAFEAAKRATEGVPRATRGFQRGERGGKRFTTEDTEGTE
jgi:regulatory protein